MDSTFREIVDLWKEHVHFNNWTLKSPEDLEIKNNSEIVYKKTNIEDIPFL